MFWNKSKPAAPAVPPVVPPYDPSSLEKGADSDRSSDYVCFGGYYRAPHEV